MKRALAVFVASVLVAIPALAAVSVAPDSGQTLFEFEVLVGVSGAFVGSANPVRGVNGGGLPWVLEKGEARLTSDGVLKVEVEGLVLASGPLAGTNPAPFFFATLSCLDSNAAVANLNAAVVAVDTSGDATIESTLDLASVCFLPIVLVRGSFNGQPAGPWFAASGF